MLVPRRKGMKFLLMEFLRIPKINGEDCRDFPQQRREIHVHLLFTKSRDITHPNFISYATGVFKGPLIRSLSVIFLYVSPTSISTGPGER